MVCPNCHSDQVIAVQDQHFCINCGQNVPEDAVARGPKPRVAVQENGLPEGVKILPVNPVMDAVSDAVITSPEAVEQAVPESTHGALIHGRSRLAAVSTEPPTTVKRRKPGRPKAGRIDQPRAVANLAPAAPATPKIAPPSADKPTTDAASSQRRLSDLAPRHAAPHSTHPAAAPEKLAPKTDPADKPATAKPSKSKRARAHRVGVSPIHYGPIIAFSLRARARPRLVILAALGAVSLGIASAYGAWTLLNGGLTHLADAVSNGGPRLIAEALLLALIYYIGRSLGQTAITYGIAREADQRPVTLSRQFGIAVNTFGRRVALDIGYGSAELTLLVLGAALMFTGGANWPIDSNLQIALIFAAFLVILYLLAALALSRGLAGVNLTLTTHRTGTAAKLGWQLFSHRVELIGPRFGALLMEAVLAVPLIVLGVALVVSAPAQYHLAVAIGAGLLAWLAGALLGVGTAAWWTMLYRQLVLVDRPHAAVALLSSRQPEDARRGPLAAIVALSTLALAATLILPFIQLG